MRMRPRRWPTYGLDLGARVAVSTGPVVVPAGDAPPHVLYNALGDTVNVAARLQVLGGLVVCSATAHEIVALVDVEPLGDVRLKGRGAPVARLPRRRRPRAGAAPCGVAVHRARGGARGAGRSPRRLARWIGRHRLHHRRTGHRQVTSRAPRRSASPATSGSSRATPWPTPRRSRTGRSASSSGAGSNWASPIRRRACAWNCGPSLPACSTATRAGVSVPRHPARPSPGGGARAAGSRARARRRPTRDLLLDLPAGLRARGESVRCAWCSRISTGRTRRRCRFSTSCCPQPSRLRSAS